MYLKYLELYGFKSFGKKTVFEFKPGLTAIVGPNGSGKSNICDAIRWVLGEQSAKALRGSKMSEVIFAGSNTLKPAQYSHVKIFLSNEDRAIPIERDEIVIARQLFRSGESYYFLNDSKSLLSEIRELLMDTGIGKEGYSIIAQGDIDDVIFQKSQSRRVLIEEAAGITKFKHRKHNTLLKLEHTRTNIVRLKDIISEIESQLEPLSKQAEKTRKYISLTNQIKELEVDLLLFDLVNLYSEKESLESMRKGLIAKITEIESFLIELESKKNKVKSIISEVEENLKANQNLYKDLNTQIENKKLKIFTLKEQIKSNHTKILTIKDELLNIDKRIETFDNEIATSEYNLQKELEIETEINASILEIEQNIDKVQNELQQFLKEISQDKDNYFELGVQIAERKNKINSVNQQLQMIERQLNKNLDDESSLQKQIEKLNSEKNRLENEVCNLQKEIDQLNEQLIKDKQKLNTLENEIKNKEIELANVKDQIKISLAKKNILNDIKNSSDAGISKGVRDILALANTELKGIYGIVGDLITVPKGYEVAFENALGGSIQDIVTQDAETAKKAIDILKARNLGKATFLPLDIIQPLPRIDKPNYTGCLGVALDLVEYDLKFYNVMSYLFGRILIFDNLDNAISFTKVNRNFNRIVTLDGDIIRSSGAISGGSDSKKSFGLLLRKRELEELEEKIRVLEKQSSVLQSRINNLYLERTKLLNSIQYAESLISKKKNSIEFILNNLEKYKNELKEKTHEKENFSLFISDLKSEKDRLEQIKFQAQNDLKELEKQNIELSTRISAMSNKEESIQTRLSTLKGLLNDKKMLLVQNHERQKSIRKEIETTIKRKNEVLERKEHICKEITSLQDANKSLSENINIYQNELEILTKQKEELEKKIDEIQQLYQNSGKELNNFDNTYQSRIRMLESTKTKLSELDIKLTEINTNIKNKENILTYDYGYDFTQAFNMVRKYNSREEITNILVQKKEERLQLEPVNLLAIEEYEKTKERYDFLNAQVKDLTDAANSLEQVIAEIEKISSERFLATFNKISSAFNSIFQFLFPGGEGRLELVDSSDVLNSNIEIVCKLPGKKITSLEAFSGGEKALIALTLLFAIMQVKPPAFCLLDEVEASLDDINVKRFTKLLKNFSNKTQIIVITHNKETMQAVDTIYGITLEKDGISRPISIRLDEAISAISSKNIPTSTTNTLEIVQ